MLMVALMSTALTLPNKVDFIIRNVKLFDGNQVMEHVDVFVKDGLVTMIKPTERKVTCQYKKMIDGNGKTLIPGLINAHVHLGTSVDLQEAARAGVLTVIELLRMQEDSISLYKQLSSLPKYAYFYTSGIGADMPNAVIKRVSGGKQTPPVIDSRTSAQNFLANRIKNKVDCIKIFQDSRLPEKFSDSIFEQLVQESHKYHLVTAVHAQTLKDATYAFDKGADILAHLWGDYSITDSCLQQWKQRQFYITPTLLLELTVLEQLHPKSVLFDRTTYLQEIQKLNKAGLKLLAGTDSPNLNLNYTDDLFKELYLFVEAGMTPVEALKTATSNAAEAYRIKDKGVIKENASADFVLVNGDVTKDIHQLKKVISVWKNGMKIN